MARTFPIVPGPQTDQPADLRRLTLEAMDALLDELRRGRMPLQLPNAAITPTPTPYAPTGMHLHQVPEVFLQLGGSTDFHFPGDAQLHLAAGQVAVLPSRLPHHETIHGGQRFANLVFILRDSGLSYHLAKAHPDHPRRPMVWKPEIVHGPLVGLVAATLEGLALAAESAPTEPQVASAWLTAFASGMREAIRRLDAQPAPDPIDRCRDLIAARLHQGDLSVAQLAGWVGLHPDHLCRRFRRLTGITVVGWIIAQRMQRAGEALLREPLPVAEIGRMVGYADPGYFARVFRRIHGCSPQAWRDRRS